MVCRPHSAPSAAPRDTAVPCWRCPCGSDQGRSPWQGRCAERVVKVTQRAPKQNKPHRLMPPRTKTTRLLRPVMSPAPHELKHGVLNGFAEATGPDSRAPIFATTALPTLFSSSQRCVRIKWFEYFVAFPLRSRTACKHPSPSNQW